MSKRPLGKGTDSKTTQTGIPANTHNESKRQLIEMAAEQFADLFWKCWLARNTTMRDKRTKSGSRPDSPRSS